MREYCIVILNRFPELAQNLIASIKRTHNSFKQILVVCDQHRESLQDCQQIYVAEPFVFSRNVNLALNMIGAKDAIIVNDDCECVEENFFPKLVAIANKYNKCGILSPLIDGGVGNELQQYPPIKIWKKIKSPEIITDRTVCFVCAYLNREMINQIGMLDERFIHYGFDDDDYCYRAREAGWRTMITSSLHIKHGSGGQKLIRGINWSCSFARVPDLKSNIEIFLDKYPQFRIK